jgi:ribosomal protein S18 acetylase RimI-like enzyme
MSDFTIEIAKEASPALLKAVRSLLPQLTTSGRLIAASELRAMIESPLSTMFIAKSGTEIVGMISLSVAQMPTGLRSYLEDLVVDSSCRRRGIARALLEAAIDHARNAGARTLDMTSRPSRHGAIELYKELGFQLRQTNPYRFPFHE